MSAALIERLVEFAECGNQQKIIIKNTRYQGWIMEITEDALLISIGFADKSGKEFWLKFTDLAAAQLYYWDNHVDEWVAFNISP